MKVAVIGAGPGGLSMGYYLAKQGVTDFVIFEKLGRVGGMCKSITYKGQSFDLGANYVTSSYTTIKKMAREVGAKFYVEKPGTTFDPYSDPPQWKSIMAAATGQDGMLKVGIASIRYLFKRMEIADVVDQPGFAQFQGRPEYLVSFQTWLEQNDLAPLETLFSIPITLMGYGELHQIAAPYALKYMAPGSFCDLLLYGAGIPYPLRQHPKRFLEGFQRFWERVAADLPVRFNTTIVKIEREIDGVYITYSYPEQVQNETRTRTVKRERYDQLVIASPQELALLEEFLDVTESEKKLFGQVLRDPYCLTTFDPGEIELENPIVNILPIPSRGKPFVLTQQFPGNPLLSFYSRLPETEKQEANPTAPQTEPDSKATRRGRREVLKQCIRVLRKLKAGGKGVKTPPAEIPEPDDYVTHDEWNYFLHVPVTAFQAGWYSELEALQGQNRTWFAGGLLCFDLIEPIVEYSQDLASRITGS